MPLGGLCRPSTALTRHLVQRPRVPHGRQCSFVTLDKARKLVKKERRCEFAKHCSTLAVTRCTESVLSDFDTNSVQAVKSSLEIEILGDAALPVTPVLEQRTAEWHDLRKGRITASAFGNALGLWRSGRVELWEEKIGLRKPFAGNQATRWGTNQEAGAIERYKQITGNVVEHMAFKIYKEGDDLHGWLGASPDGLIDANVSKSYTQGGILEVKCPHNKGNPEKGVPWQSVPYYYMPQAQGLLEIFDRDWMDFYVWCLNGSAVYRIYRDEEYWGLIFRVMSEYWWGHIVPAKHHLQRGVELERVKVHKPQASHQLTDEVVTMSRLLAARAPLVWKDVYAGPNAGTCLEDRLQAFYSL